MGGTRLFREKNPALFIRGEWRGEGIRRAGAPQFTWPRMAVDNLRLSDFMTSNGPDVHVVLARGDDKDLGQEIVKGNFDYVELGRLKRNQGDQNYDVPASDDLQRYNPAVIYCERFHAIFAAAPTHPF